MPISRRDFMKVFGMSLAASILAGCRMTNGQPTTAPTLTPSPIPTLNPAWRPQTEQIRQCWLSFDEVSGQMERRQNNGSPWSNGSGWSALGSRLKTAHRAALDELVAIEALEPIVADLIHEAYEAAIGHIWRLHSSVTCYIIGGPAYSIASANSLIEQARILKELADEEIVDTETVKQARAALEHDLAFYALTEEETAALMDPVPGGEATSSQGYPKFEDIRLEIHPEAQAAAEFLMALLSGDE